METFYQTISKLYAKLFIAETEINPKFLKKFQTHQNLFIIHLWKTILLA